VLKLIHDAFIILETHDESHFRGFREVFTIQQLLRHRSSRHSGISATDAVAVPLSSSQFLQLLRLTMHPTQPLSHKHGRSVPLSSLRELRYTESGSAPASLPHQTLRIGILLPSESLIHSSAV
jgi:hypothetical protein